MTTLFDPVTCGALALNNRVVMAPLTRNRAPDAIPTPLMATYYTQRATAGLIISEATAITQQGQGYADVPGLYGTEQLDGWKKVTHAVHQAGGKIVVQLWHVGRISHTSLQPGGAAPVSSTARDCRIAGLPSHTQSMLKRVRHLESTGPSMRAARQFTPPSVDTSTRLILPRPDQASPEML